MATTEVAIGSERVSQTMMRALVSNIDSATSLNESFSLPSGFGDCLVTHVTLQWSGIETIVAAGAMRGPAGFVIVTGATRDMIGDLGDWHRVSSTSVIVQHELDRPVLWRQDETLNFQAFGEDTGVADTSDITLNVRVIRLRNLGP